MIERKGYSLKVRDLKESGEFIGFASVYGKPDLMGDMVERGAFSKSIREQGDGLVMLWNHNADMPIGSMRVEDDPKGLIGHGRIDLDDAEGRAAHNRLLKGYVKGLSIGFQIPASADAVRYDAEGIRHLHQVRLLEVSLTAIPAMPEAQVIAAKSLRDMPRILAAIEPGQLAAGELKALRDARELVDRLLQSSAPEAPDPALLADLRDLAKLVRVQ
jgi:uncharacterized protein